MTSSAINMLTNYKLNRCPFCGKEPKILYTLNIVCGWPHNNSEFWHGHQQVHCQCSATGPQFYASVDSINGKPDYEDERLIKAIKDAVDAWNTRPN